MLVYERVIIFVCESEFACKRVSILVCERMRVLVCESVSVGTNAYV